MREKAGKRVTFFKTWLTLNDAAVCKEITPNGYRLFHCPRTDRRGGGTALSFRESLNVRRLSTSEKTSFEFFALALLEGVGHIPLWRLIFPPRKGIALLDSQTEKSNTD